jgi:acyl-homoserine lactone acylase PvdQ
MDQVSPYSKEISSYILSAFENIKVTDKNLELALELLKDWNYDLNEFSQVPAIYSVFYMHLLRNIYHDELGDDLFNQYVFVGSVAYRSVITIFRTLFIPGLII